MASEQEPISFETWFSVHGSRTQSGHQRAKEAWDAGRTQQGLIDFQENKKVRAKLYETEAQLDEANALLQEAATFTFTEPEAEAWFDRVLKHLEARDAQD